MLHEREGRRSVDADEREGSCIARERDRALLLYVTAHAVRTVQCVQQVDPHGRSIILHTRQTHTHSASSPRTVASLPSGHPSSAQTSNRSLSAALVWRLLYMPAHAAPTPPPPTRDQLVLPESRWPRVVTR